MHDLDALAARIAERLLSRRETLAIAESSSGGLISAALLAVSGASGFYLGGAVIYTVAARRALLGIDLATMDGIRPATEPYAGLLARTVRERHGATWGLGESGAAGPTGNRYGDPAGHACLAVSGPTDRAATAATGSTVRADNMRLFAVAGLSLLDAVLAGPD